MMGKSPGRIIEEYIELLTTHHVKSLGRELNDQEIELFVSLLQAVAADIDFEQHREE